MAGRQRRKEMIHVLERRLALWLETQDEGKEYTVLDYVIDWVESGNTLTKLADEVSEVMKWDISRAMLTNYVTGGDPIVRRRLEKARLEGAHGAVDQAVKIIDAANTSDKEQLQKAKMQADARFWVAERWNRTDLGKAPDISVVVNSNTLHLDAMRMRAVQLEPANRVTAGEAQRARLISVETTHSDGSVIADAIDAEVLEP